MMGELRELFSDPVIQWAPRLTLVFLLAFRPWNQQETPGRASYILGKAYLGLLIAGLLLQELSASPGYWLFLTGIHFLWIISAYSIADNHRYLEGYWCLSIAIALGFGGANASGFLELDARFLLGLCFLLAALQKVSASRYRDGSFFIHALLLENRFLPISLWCGGLTAEVQIRHQQARQKVVTGHSDSEQAPVPARLRRIGLFLAWWTIAVEAMLAILFLAPLPGNLELWRVLGLALFLVTVYIWVPVPTFGFAMLLLLAVAVQEPGLRMTVLGLAAILLIISGVALAFRELACRRMAAMRREASIPRFCWTAKARPHRLGEDGKLEFPMLGVSLYVKNHWSESLKRWLNAENAISWEELTLIASDIPETELEEFVRMLTQFRLLSHSKPIA